MNIFFKQQNYIYNGITLDKKQTQVVTSNYKNLLVVAGAGSGKTFTISARVDYLINVKKVKHNSILCLSFTNESVNDLKSSLDNNNLKIDVMTFHKFSLSILKNKYRKAPQDLLEYIIDEYFYSFINFNKMNKLLDYYLEEECLNREIFLNTFKKVIFSFINTFKSQGYKQEHFLKLIKTCHNSNDLILLLIIFDIYILYEEELNSEAKIDFNDMIVKSEEEVKKQKYFKYKYIIIDEYQDISFIRYNLIHTIVEKFSCNLLAVGDDYQSIYSFSGTNIYLFTKFKRFFKNSKIIKLKKTFRNPKDVVDISNHFIRTNKGQIKKRLISYNYINNSIYIVYTKNERETFKKIAQSIDNIMILSRNKRDIENILDDNVKQDGNQIIYENKKIKYLTVHSSKGLEEDNVIILNNIDDTLGFPNKLRENELLRYIKKEERELEEERRLFYVALTRCKKRVYIFTDKDRKSIFVKELLKKYSYKIQKIYEK